MVKWSNWGARIEKQEAAIETPAAPTQARVVVLTMLLGMKAQQGLKNPQDPLKEAYDKAIENAPKIGEEAAAATKKLADGEPAGARPHQDEALRLLKEIEDTLPKDNQQQQQQEQQQNEQKEQQQQEQQQQQKLSPEQIEALLRKAEEREREHKEKKKAAAVATGQVDRDW